MERSPMAIQEPEAALIQFGTPERVTANLKERKRKVSKGFLTSEDRGGLKQKHQKHATQIRSSTCSFVAMSNSDQEILNLIAPPRVWFEDRKQWKQMVSSVPSTRTDVLELKKKMYNLLKARGARRTGFCEIRRGIYTQVFDEVIRHITVNCAERGLMLILVRDDLRHVAKYFERIYTSAVAYGIRKTLQALQLEDTLIQEIRKLKSEVDHEQKIYDEMIPHYTRFAEQYQKQSDDTDKEFQEECDKMEKKKKSLKALVEQSVGLKKAPPKVQKENKPKLLDKLANISQT